MVLKIYSVFDKKTVLYGRPFYAHNSGHAIRCMQDEVDRGEKDSQLARYPSDFALYSVGAFDDNKGIITPIEPICIIEITDLVKEKDNG